MKAAEIKELALEALRYGNPYKTNAVKYYVGDQPRYLFAGESMTEKEIDEAYLDTAKKDIKRGYDERMVGYYDKWYRYNHSDEGRAYDMGVRAATTNPKCKQEMIIIECSC